MSATPPNPDVRLSRRDFLSWAWKGMLALSSLLGLGVLLRFFDYQDEPPQPTTFDLGLAEKYPAGSVTLVPEAQAVLLHEAGGFRALSNTCPHLGCTVEAIAGGFRCPCHGSKFDRHGAVQTGPATITLQNFRLETTAEGRLILHTDPAP
jgi:cytochrome b6-f complex iron-sulfur subunit